MKLWAEIPAFGALAVGVHLALFAGWSGGAPEAAGNQGSTTLTLSGSSGAAEAMVAAWEAPPPVPETVTAVPPSFDSARPVLPTTERLTRPSSPAIAAEAAPDAGPDARPEEPPAHFAPVAEAPGVVTAPAAGEDTPPSPGAEMAVARPGVSRRAVPPALAEAPPAADAPAMPKTRPRARPDQVAAGAGGTGLRGVRNDAPVPGLSDGARRSIVAAWGAEIRARIESRKIHPEGLRASGRPVVRITVARSGALEDVRVIRSSRVAALDAAALQAVRRAGRFPAAPGGFDLARVSFDLPISFTR